MNNLKVETWEAFLRGLEKNNVKLNLKQIEKLNLIVEFVFKFVKSFQSKILQLSLHAWNVFLIKRASMKSSYENLLKTLHKYLNWSFRKVNEVDEWNVANWKKIIIAHNEAKVNESILLFAPFPRAKGEQNEM